MISEGKRPVFSDILWRRYALKNVNYLVNLTNDRTAVNVDFLSLTAFLSFVLLNF